MQYYDNYVNHQKKPQSARQAHSAGEHVANHSHPTMVHAETNKQEYYKLGGVFAVIAVCATIMSTVLGFDLQIWMEWFMGGFFIIFGSFKLIGYEMFVLTFPQYDPIAKRSSLYTHTYPFIELFLGFLFTANLLPLFRNIVTFTIFSIGAYGVLRYISRAPQNAVQCACLGNVIKLPLSTVTLIEDVLMSGMAVIMIIGYFFQ